MTDVFVDVSKLRTVPEHNSWDIFITGIEEKYTDCSGNCRYYWSFYRSWIIFGIILLIISIGIVMFMIFKPPTPSYPCISYQSNTLASSVSVACLQYVWSSNCQVPYIFPSDYTGWWRRSPQGTVMVSCRGTSDCGVGSYNNIIIYLALCRIELNQ